MQIMIHRPWGAGDLPQRAYLPQACGRLVPTHENAAHHLSLRSIWLRLDAPGKSASASGLANMLDSFAAHHFTAIDSVTALQPQMQLRSTLLSQSLMVLKQVLDLGSPHADLHLRVEDSFCARLSEHKPATLRLLAMMRLFRSFDR